MAMLSVVIPGRNEVFMRKTVENLLVNIRGDTDCPVVYILTNKINGKQYVGQTRQGMRERLKRHIQRALAGKNCCPALAAAIRKHGPDAFCVSVHRLDVQATQSSIDAYEQQLIRVLNTISPNGYNLSSGGKGGRPSEETLAKRSAALRGKPLTPEHRQKLSDAQKGRPRTSEAERAGYARRAEALRGKPRDPAIIAKAVATKKGRPRSEKQIAAAARHAAFMRGRTASPATREKMRASRLAYFASRITEESSA